MANTYTLPDLPYDLGDLEPVINAEIMDLHYNKHHKTYINNLNNLLEQLEEAQSKKDISKEISLQSGINFNGGGYINHSIFWTNLAPKGKGGGEAPSGPLADAIMKDFGSLDKLKETMTAKTVAVQGSGWGWLGYNKSEDRLEIAICQNQDPLAAKGLVPLLGIDVWEHAYYLQYKNVRPDYVKAIWEIVNWKNVSERYEAAL
ncbi:Fe-Mn family superoxide dismutase [Waddlia chondrophila]|uniref:Superoxide dismutase n=1 Tax=Waddlia chondrophila (strain ATCC VR-1470 / WSU 86-1044) TaxID=716544 RepID=D6YU13_WADCW|nr:Fe-Mn family superoxide dismutase [Waddlia chondrophila]ADI37624.1 Superoxide dismutase [Waddlia chondrophila WSU 86-1044]